MSTLKAADTTIRLQDYFGLYGPADQAPVILTDDPNTQILPDYFGLYQQQPASGQQSAGLAPASGLELWLVKNQRAILGVAAGLAAIALLKAVSK